MDESAPTTSFNASPPQLAGRLPELENQDTSVLIATTMEMIFLVLIFAANLVSNTLVFVIFYQRPALRSLSNRFVLNLAFCDLLYSMLVIPYVMVAMVSEGGAVAVWWCRFTKVATVLLALGCAFSIVLIAVDRYCAVMNPLHYSMTITRGRSSCMIAAVWMMALAVASPPLAGLGRSNAPTTLGCDCWTTITMVVATAHRTWYSVTVSSLGFVLPVVLLCWIYACMYRAARQSSVRVRRQSTTLNPSEIILHEAGCNGSSGECTPVNAGNVGTALLGGSGHANFQAFKKTFYRRRSSNASVSVVFFREEGRAAQTGLLVIATFAFCWFPYFAFVVLEAHPEWKTVPALGRTLAQHLTFVGCALNPFVYVYRNRMVWKDARHVLHCRRHGYAATAKQRTFHKALSGCGGGATTCNNNNNYNHVQGQQRLLLLNKEVVCWRNHGVVRRQASKTILRVAIDDGTSDPAGGVELVPLERFSDGRIRVSVTNEHGLDVLEAEGAVDAMSVDGVAVPSTTTTDCLKVEVIHGSSWSLPNQNVAYLIRDEMDGNMMQFRNSGRSDICFSDNYLTSQAALLRTDGCAEFGIVRTIPKDPADLLGNSNNNNINNNNSDNVVNNNNDDVNENYHLGLPTFRNNNSDFNLGCHLGYPPTTANHNRCASATSLIFRVAHPSHSYPGTTI